MTLPATNVTGVSTVTALRAGVYSNHAYISLNGYASSGDGGGGLLALSEADTTSDDNDCTIFVDAAGNRFYRILSPNSVLTSSQCGIFPGTGADLTNSIINALDVCAGILEFQFDLPGVFKVTSHLTSPLSGGTSATQISIRGVSPAFLSDDGIPKVTTAPGTVSNGAGGTAITGTDTTFTQTFSVGDQITIGPQTQTVTVITNDLSLTVGSGFTSANTNASYEVTNYIINPAAGATFNQFTPPYWITRAYSIILFSPAADDCLFGQADTGSAYGFESQLCSLKNLVLWGGTAHALMGIHTRSFNVIEECTFVMFAYFGVLYRAVGDNVSQKRVSYMDNGYALTPTNTTVSGWGHYPHYQAGAAICVSNTGGDLTGPYTTFGVYAGTYQQTNYYLPTQISIRDVTIWVRSYWAANKWGYAGIQLYATGDCLLENVQSVSGLAAFNARVHLESCHFETYSTVGLNAADTTNVACALFWESFVGVNDGWLGKAFQSHTQGVGYKSSYNQISPIAIEALILGSGNYGNAGGFYGVPGFQWNSAQNPISICGLLAGKGGIFLPISTTANTAAQTFVWTGVMGGAILAWSGQITITISITSGGSVNKFAQYTYPVMFSTASGTPFITAGAASSTNAALPATWTVSWAFSTNANGDFILTPTYTNWTNGTAIQVDISFYGGPAFGN